MGCYVIIDLEMCRVPKGEPRALFGASNELIQIGAVRLDDSLAVCDTFMTHVRPEFGVLDDFIQKLTGITPADLADAPMAEEAFRAFLDWLPEDATIVSWSFSDLEQVIAELDGKGIDLPEFDPYLDEWLDCQATFGEKLHAERSYKLSEALNIANIYYNEGEHDALVDARNTALLFAKMQTEEELRLSPYFMQNKEQSGGYTPFAELLKGFSDEKA